MTCLTVNGGITSTMEKEHSHTSLVLKCMVSLKKESLVIRAKSSSRMEIGKKFNSLEEMALNRYLNAAGRSEKRVSPKCKQNGL